MKSANKKITAWTISVIVIILIVIGVWFFSAKNVQGDFVSTGEKIQNQLQQISILTSQSLYQFQAISEKQKAGDFKTALDLIIEERNRNNEINTLALTMTEELKNLAKLSIKLSEQKDRTKVEEAIQYQIEGTGHLINYRSGVDVLLQEMAEKYEGVIDNQPTETKRDIGKLIEWIKTEIETAQDKSKQFIDTISQIYNSDN